MSRGVVLYAACAIRGNVEIHQVAASGGTLIYRHLPSVTVQACFSHDRTHRYWLEISRDACGHGETVCAVMQNPSYADEAVADRSVQFLEKLVLEKRLREFQGVTRLIVVNQFALIRTKGFAGDSTEEIEKNDAYLSKALGEADIVLLAWGKANPFRDRQAAIKNMLRALPGKRIYETAKHPSRGSYENFLRQVDVI